MSHFGQRFSALFYFFVMEFETLYAFGPLLGAALAAGGSIVSGLLNRKAQEKANDQNQKNFEAQMAENKRQFNMNFRQQSILDQLRQMRAGGQNPAAANVGVASSPSSGSGTSLPNMTPENGFAMGLEDMALKSAQVANIASNTRKTNEELDGVKFTNAILASDAKFRDAFNQGSLNLQSSQTELNWSSTNRIDYLTPLEASQMRAVTKQTLQSVDNMKEDIKRITALTSNLEQNTKESQARVKSLEQQIKESISKEWLNYKEGHKMDKDMEYLDSLIGKLNVEIAEGGLRCQLDGFNIDIMQDGGVDLQKAIIDWDSKLLPITKMNEIIAPYLQVLGSSISAAAKSAAIIAK